MAGGLWPAAPQGDEVDCPGGEIAEFGDLAERLEEYDGITVLSVELLVSPTRACRETWIVEVLTEEDEVAALLFNARTLEERFAGFAPEHDDEDDEHEEEALEPVRSELVGRHTSDLIEGYWTDDEMTGGAGRDVFVVTPGTDVIFDFEPGQDILDVGDFARLEEGFGVLRSMEDIRRAARLIRFDDQPATEIDINGPVDDWAVILIGVRPGELTEENIHFGIEDDPEPDLPFTHWPARRIESAGGSVVIFPAYRIDERPPRGRLLEGDDAFRERVRGFLMDLYEVFEAED